MATTAICADYTLVLQAKDGSRECFDLLVLRHRDEMVGYLYRIVSNRAIAEELAQETFLRAYRSLGRYQPTARFATWLYSIATRLALNWIRDNRRVYCESLDDEPDGGRPLQLVDTQPLPDAMAIRSWLCRTVRDAVRGLPERQREVVVMHKYRDMSYREIALAWKCSPAAVKSLLFRAHSALREKLAQPLQMEPRAAA
jgi:RNA polymerase sigma-70 factor, ECF subfamily